jgi:hypothetical protein
MKTKKRDLGLVFEVELGSDASSQAQAIEKRMSFFYYSVENPVVSRR